MLLGLCLLALCIGLPWALMSGAGTSPASKAPAATRTTTAAALATGQGVDVIESGTTAVVPAAYKSAKSAPASAAARKTAAAKSSVTAKPTSAAADTPAPATGTSAVASSGLVGFSAPALLDQSSSVQIQQFEQMKAMGMTTVRFDADWYYGEPSSGTYDWRALDVIMASIQKVGLTADMIIDGCPPWAAAPGGSGIFEQPASPAAFGSWAAAVAARYSGEGARVFEIWNEPNLPAFWTPSPNPAAYTADLQAAYSAIKAVDSSAIVISGGLSPADNTSDSYDPVTFLQDMYADGAQGYFDGVGDHPYSYPFTPADESQGAWGEMGETSPSLRSLMAAHGDSAKKIWITEYGAPTTGSNAVSETDQSTEIVDALTEARQTSWIASFYIYTWSDQFSDDGFGVLDSSGGQKPAYSAVAALTS
jgi:hypothetical protein